MSKLLDDLKGRYIGVDDNPEYDQEIVSHTSDKLKSCSLCGKLFVKNHRAVYCGRQHYTTCVNCGKRIDITAIYFRGGFVPKTCCKSCADQVGVQTHKKHFSDMADNTNAIITRKCKICGNEFTVKSTYPKQCCSVECASKLRSQKINATVKICKFCGKPFTSNFSKSLYCSGPHYQKCVICGKSFEISNLQKPPKTCSAKCKDILSRQTNLEKYGVEIGSQSEVARKKLSAAYYANHPEKLIKVNTKICKLCGKPYFPDSSHKTICSDKHYRKCEVCGKEFLITMPSNSQKCCSPECTIQKRKTTMEKRYGVPYAIQNAEIKKKSELSTLHHYGVLHAAQSADVKEKMKQTCQEKYGTDSVFASNEFKQKSKETCLSKYGVEFVTQSDEFKSRGETTCIEKYGVRRPMQSREIHQKMWDTRKTVKASDGTPFDSSYEVKVYEFWKSLGLDVERNIPITYEYNGEMHTTFIDFKVGDVLFEVKGLHLLEGVYDYKGIPIGVKLDMYKKHHVVLITDKSDKTIGLFGTPNSTTSNGLKYLSKCPEPLIGVDISLFTNNPEFPYAEDRPKCFYDVKVDGKPSAFEAFSKPDIRWKMIYNRIQYSGGFIDNHQVLTAMNVTRTCKQPSWFSKILANRLISTYCSQSVVYDLAAGWGARADACTELGKTYVACDFNKELVDWHIAQGRDTISWHDGRTFKYDKPCSIFICPPYSDPKTGKCFEDYNFEGFDESAQTLTQCQWLKIAMENASEFADATMVCKVVDPNWEKYVVETIDNKSHFGINHEYVIHITREQYITDFL